MRRSKELDCEDMALDVLPRESVETKVLRWWTSSESRRRAGGEMAVTFWSSGRSYNRNL